MFVVQAALLLCVSACPDHQRGILVMAHGGEPEWNQQVEAVVEPLRSKLPVAVAYGMARTSTLKEAVRQLEERGVKDVAVVRMFISGESFLPETEFILGLRDSLPEGSLAAMAAHGAGGHHAGGGAAETAGATHGDAPGATAQEHGDADHCMEKPERITTSCRFRLSRQGVAESTLVEDIVLARVAALSREPARESVLFLAHGPADDEENQRWLAQMRQRTAGVAKLGPFREVRCETLREDWPEKRTEAENRIRAFVEQAGAKGGRCIVVPFRVAGFGPYRDVLEGLTYVSDGLGFCPHTHMTRWIEETANGCFAQASGETGSNKAAAGVGTASSGGSD